MWTDPVDGGLRQVFRYTKAARTRLYGLKALDERRVELWVVASERGRVRGSRKLVTFEDDEVVEPFLREVEHELRRGGWSRA